jgi:hypothetical protein
MGSHSQDECVAESSLANRAVNPILNRCLIR